MATTLLLFAAVLGFIHAAGSLAALEVEQIVDPEELRKSILPPPPALYDSWTDWETWEASSDIVKFLPYYRSGYDEDGRVVYVIEYGKWNLREFTQLSEQKVQEVLKYHEQYVRRVERDSSLNNNQGIVLILDWDGFDLGHYASAPALKIALQLFAPLVRVSHALKYGFFINVNFAAETFITTAKAFSGDLLDKMEVYGTRSAKWRPMILRKISASQLSPKYGGNQDWEPLPLD